MDHFNKIQTLALIMYYFHKVLLNLQVFSLITSAVFFLRNWHDPLLVVVRYKPIYSAVLYVLRNSMTFLPNQHPLVKSSSKHFQQTNKQKITLLNNLYHIIFCSFLPVTEFIYCAKQRLLNTVLNKPQYLTLYIKITVISLAFNV